MSVMLIDPRHAADLARRYRTWRYAFAGAVEAEMVWEPCPRCWSQGREFVQSDGEWSYRDCVRCFGVGQVPA